MAFRKQTRGGLAAAALLFVAVWCTADARGDELPEPVVSGDYKELLHLKGGDKLTGTGGGLADGQLRWERPDGPVLMVPLDAVDHVEYLPLNPRPATQEEMDEAVFGEVPGPIADRPEDRPFGPAFEAFVTARDFLAGQAREWTKRAELGARFIDGNSDDDFVNVAGEFERSHNDWLTHFDFGGQYGRSKGTPTTNRWWGNVTFDHSKKSKWIVFLTAKNEYDEFENLDYRGTYSSGLGYRFFNEPQKRLIARVGPGFTYEQYRDPRDVRETADLFGELEVKWPVFDVAHFESKTTMHPSVEDFSIFRAVSNNGLLFQLDEHGRWNLKMGFRYEYNGRPSRNREPDDYTTSLLLVYTRKK